MLLGLVFWLCACGGVEPTPVPTIAPTVTTAASAGQITIVALGDSLTEGLGVDPQDAYPAQLERKLQTAGYAVQVINAGVSGETSSGALTRVEWILQLQPQIVILGTGGNDSLRGVDPKLTAQNIRQLVEKLQQANIVVVLAGMQTTQNLGAEYTTAFAAIYPVVAQEYKLILIPFLLEGVAGDPKLNQRDFIHPTAAGYAVVVETVYPYVVAALAAVNY